jgi:GNAT superfamily N-acetyltransferase
METQKSTAIRTPTRTIDATVRIRAIVPSDADNYRSILQRTSAEDRYCRFFHVVDHFDDAAVDSYVKASPDTIGLIAEKHGKPLGVAHAFFIDEGCAETAFVVANDARHLGVGRLLFERLIAALQQRPCTSVIAYALAQNGPFSNLARSFGMRPGAADGGIVTWTLSLAGSRRAQHPRVTSAPSVDGLQIPPIADEMSTMRGSGVLGLPRIRRRPNLVRWESTTRRGGLRPLRVSRA